MADFTLKDIRTEVDKEYVGFNPNGGNPKPVHIYTGLSRVVFGKTCITENIKRFSFVSNKKGLIPKNGDPESIRSWLVSEDYINKSISATDLSLLRTELQKVLSTDDGVFSEKDDTMIAYSAGSDIFITNRGISESGGEFIAHVIQKFCPQLVSYIKDILSNHNDPISLLVAPLISNSNEDIFSSYENIEVGNIKLLEESSNANFSDFGKGVYESGKCLMKHFMQTSNKLIVLRQFNLFALFHLFRYMTRLDNFYNGTLVIPFVLDFSGKPSSSIAKLSAMSYIKLHCSLSNFYSWAFGSRLDKNGYTIDELLCSDTPLVDSKKVSKKSGKTEKKKEEELNGIWELAKETSKGKNIKDALLDFGTAMLDMLSTDSDSNPQTFIKRIGIRSGILIHPNGILPPRFVLHPDMLEVVMKSCVEPGETLHKTKLKERLWERMNILIGGESFDLKILESSIGTIFTDDDSLIHNFEKFSTRLQKMNFAEQMADGLLQIKLGGIKNE